MAKPAPTWGTVSLVSEPAPLVAAMAAWTVAQGAAEVHLYLDQPAPELRAMIGHLPQVRFTDCDEAFWAGTNFGKRPEFSGQRQVAMATWHYRIATVDWLLHCDADEFLWDGAALRRELAALPDRVDSLVLLNMERVFRRGVPQRRLFEGDFRRRHGRRRILSRLLYGSVLDFLNDGLSGYSTGKSITRTGRPLRVSIHRAFKDVPGKVDPVRHIARDCSILHVDGVTRLHLKIKLLLRFANMSEVGKTVMDPARLRLMQRLSVLAGKEPRALDRLCARLTSLSFWQRSALKLRGIVRTLDFAPEKLLAEVCPAAIVTPAEFDAMLRERNPELARRAEGQG